MAGSVNQVFLIGNVGKDPEIRTLKNDDKVANFTVATSESWRDKATGEKVEKTEWHSVSCFNDNLVKIIDQYVRKGSKVCVQGSLQTRKWTDKEGHDKYSTEIVLSKFKGEITLLGDAGGTRSEAPARSGGGYDKERAGGGSGGGEPSTRGGFSSGGRGGFSTADLDDDIPF